MGRFPAIAVIIASLPLLLGSAEAAYKRGARKLEVGHYRLAMHAFKKSLDQDPDFAPSRIGLGRALAGVGRCEDAVEHLGRVHGVPAWDAHAATAEGSCRLRLGDASGAEAALEEALVLRPDLDDAWYQLALVRSGQGEVCEPCLDALSGSRKGVNRYWLAQLWPAWERGDQGASWDLLWELRAQQRLTPTDGALVQAWLVEGLLWLDLGHPAEAERALAEAVGLAPTHLRSTIWLAETQRRQGLPEAAETTLDLPVLQQHAPAPAARVVLARIRVDQGRLGEAETLLAEHPDPHDPEVLATRWYLARARGEATEPWEARWPRRGSRSLHQLIPLVEEAP